MIRKLIISAVLMVFVAFQLVSCATIPEEHQGAATGAGIGAAGGAVAGALLGGNARSAVLGAMLGGLAGGVIGHYSVDQKKSRQQTQQSYNYSSSSGTMLTVEGASAAPQRVRPGEMVNLNITYALLNPSPDAATTITETRMITHNGEMVGNPETNVTRTDGTYTSTVPLRLPPDAARGTYRVTSTVRSSTASDSRETSFEVM